MGAVNTTYTFTPTDTITSTKMNNIIDETVMTSQACLAGGGLEVASGQLTISQNGVTPSRIDSNAVTTLKIADGAVTPAKFSAGGPSWNSVTVTINISQPQVEVGTGITTSTASLVDFHSVHPLTDFDARIVRYGGVNGVLEIANTGTGVILFTGSNGVNFSNANMPNPVGTAPLYSVRAFAKVATNGAVANNKGFSSITKTGTGTYNLILAVAPAEDPVVVATCHTPSENSFNYSAAVQINASNNFTVKTGFEDINSLRDMAFSIMVIY